MMNFKNKVNMMFFENEKEGKTQGSQMPWQFLGQVLVQSISGIDLWTGQGLSRSGENPPVDLELIS